MSTEQRGVRETPADGLHGEESRPERTGRQARPSMDADEWSGSYRLPRRQRPGVALVIALAMLVGVLLSSGLHLLFAAVERAARVQVPAVVGMPLERARVLLRGSSLGVLIAGSASDPLIEEGAVARQTPFAGTAVAPATQVALVLSTGPVAVSLPPLEGLPQAMAIERLASSKLQVGETRLVDAPRHAAGQVVGSDPAPGTSLAPGTRVTLLVARGTTLTVAEAPGPASAGATGQGGAPRPARRPPAGEVSKPAPAHAARAGGTVITPRITGVRLRFAVGRLRAAGLELGATSYDRDEDHIEELVLRQSPGAGSSVARGTAVDVVVNRLD